MCFIRHATLKYLGSMKKVQSFIKIFSQYIHLKIIWKKKKKMGEEKALVGLGLRVAKWGKCIGLGL